MGAKNIAPKVAKKKKPTGRPKKGSTIGRPPVITDKVLRKLKEAFLFDATDEEACFYAGISTTPFYEYQKENPDFKEQKKAWKQSPVMAARKTVVQDLKKNPDMAMKYLERKVKNEFSTRTDVHGNLTVNRMGMITLNGEALKYDFGKSKAK